jgi:PTH1 family peptidyl-tRNA hydrolase
LQCDYASATIHDTRVILCKPTTFMNLSGEAVQAIANFYKIQPVSVIVVHDELDINFGQVRMRMGGSAAGHNGVKSVTKMLGTEDYGRVRVGIGPKKPEQIDSADFVLQDFSKAEKADLSLMTQEVSSILSEYAFGATVTPETRSFL